MTVTVANTANTNTFDYWRVRTNELAYAMSTQVVTTESNTATGNASISGTFTSNSLIIGNTSVNVFTNSTSITLSNSTVSFSITKPSSAEAASGLYFLNANNSWSSIEIYSPTTNGSVTTTGTSAQLIDSYSMNSYNAAEYILSIKDNNSNNYSVTKLVSFHNTSNAYITEYALMYSNSIPGTFSANANTTHVRLYITPTSSNATIKMARVIV